MDTKNHPLFFSYKILSKYEIDKNNNDNLYSYNTENYEFLCNILLLCFNKIKYFI